MARAEESGATQVGADIETFRRKALSGVKGANHTYVILLGLEPADTTTLIRRVEKGLPFRVVERLRCNIHLTEGANQIVGVEGEQLLLHLVRSSTIPLHCVIMS